MNTKTTELFNKFVKDLKELEPDKRFRAYILATVKHECGDTWLPIKELGSHLYFAKYEKPSKLAKNLGNTEAGDGYLFSGRGYCQVTGRYNYGVFSKLLNIDLISNPDLALKHDTSLKIIHQGMTKGLFTGRKLSRYFNETECDWLNARRIINGVDCAKKIETYAQDFYTQDI